VHCRQASSLLLRYLHTSADKGGIVDFSSSSHF
jgi:hypothetical protein